METEIIKVAVRIPANRREDLKTLTAKWRAEAQPERSGGWDAKALGQIAKQHYGGYRQMFDALGWKCEDGRKLMVTAPSMVCQDKRYGSIEKFVAAHEKDEGTIV